jgi:fibronectin type III domain protein
MIRVGRASGSLSVSGILLIGSLLAACHDHDHSTLGAQTSSASPSSAKALTLSWEAPTQNADGTPLLDLRGYRIYYGTTPQLLNTVNVDNPGLTTYVIDNLTAGTYYFAVASYNRAGVDSLLTPEISTTVD